jgi:hypothetical protein
MSTSYKQPLPFKRWREGRNGADALISTYWRDYIKTDPNLTNLITCIEVVFAPDKRVFAATRPVNVVSASTGNPYQYLPILSEEPEVTASISVADGSSRARSFSIKIPNTFVDASMLLKSGRYLAGFAEVSLQYDGGNYDERIVLMRGEMDSGVTFYPADGGVIEFSVTDPKDSSDYPCPPYTVDNSENGSFTNSPDSSNGARYPMVLGKYGKFPSIWVRTGVAGPIAMVTYGKTVLGSDVVYVDGEGYGKSDVTYGWEEIQSTDNNGIAYTGIQFDNVASFSTNFSESVYMSVDEGNVKSTNPIDQIYYLVSGFTGLDEGTINQTLFSKAKSKATSINSNALLNAGGTDAASTLSFIESTVCDSFPMISMVWEGNGYRPVIVDRNAPVAYNLDVQQWPVMGRTSGVTETAKNKVANDFQLQFQYDALEDHYSGMVLRNRTNNNMCQISATNCGVRQYSPIASPYIHDTTTAGVVSDWLTAHLSQPTIEVQYQCYGIMYTKVTTGDNVKLTDDEFGWKDVIATIVGITYNSGTCTLNLIVWQTYFGIGGGSASGGLANSGTSGNQSQKGDTGGQPL